MQEKMNEFDLGSVAMSSDTGLPVQNVIHYPGEKIPRTVARTLDGFISRNKQFMGCYGSRKYRTEALFRLLSKSESYLGLDFSMDGSGTDNDYDDNDDEDSVSSHDISVHKRRNQRKELRLDLEQQPARGIKDAFVISNELGAVPSIVSLPQFISFERLFGHVRSRELQCKRKSNHTIMVDMRIPESVHVVSSPREKKSKVVVGSSIARKYEKHVRAMIQSFMALSTTVKTIKTRCGSGGDTTTTTTTAVQKDTGDLGQITQRKPRICVAYDRIDLLVLAAMRELGFKLWMGTCAPGVGFGDCVWIQTDPIVKNFCANPLCGKIIKFNHSHYRCKTCWQAFYCEQEECRQLGSQLHAVLCSHNPLVKSNSYVLSQVNMTKIEL